MTAAFLPTRRRRAATLTLTAVVALGALAAPPAGAAKKRAKKPSRVDVTTIVNAGIPDRDANPAVPMTPLQSAVQVGKRFKGLLVRDVNVTVGTTGSAAGAAQHLLAELSAPNGSTVLLFFQLAGQSIGPLTLDDDTNTFLVSTTTSPCPIPTGLCAPYAGRARPGGFQAGSPLWPMDGGRARGSWTLRFYDISNGLTSTLNSWRLEVATGRPYAEK